MITIRHIEKPDPRFAPRLKESWQEILRQGEIGFPLIPQQAQLWEALRERLDRCRPVKRVVVIGVGGSSLGTQVVAHCFQHLSAVAIEFLEAPDPHFLRRFDSFTPDDWRERHVVIVSKSGNTVETLAWVEQLACLYPQWLKRAECTVVASPGDGALQKWAAREGLACLWIPSSVGGRFSVLTAAGMFPAGLMGLHLDKFREGAQWALANPGLVSTMSAEILSAWDRHAWVTQMWTYAEGLRVFGEWWQQLWGESLAKKTERVGNTAAPRASTPMACLGPRDQHSMVQQLIEGARDKQVIITRVKAVELSVQNSFTTKLFPDMPFYGRQISLGEVLAAQADAFELSLRETGIPFATLEVEDLSERSLGALFMFWQMTIAQLGQYMGIDAFNQPGVELGKKYAAQFLRGLKQP